MPSIENLSGKKLQIKFSPIYINQGAKTDLDSDLTVEAQTESLIDCVRYLSAGTTADTGKLELFALMTSLGKVEHGKKGLDYINELLPDNVPEITEPELVYFNLKRIFKSFEETIGMETFQEFCEIYKPEQESDSLEVKIIKLAIIIEKISQGVRKTISSLSHPSESSVTGTQLKLIEMKKIKESYRKNDKIELTAKLKELYPKVNRLYQTCELSPEHKEEIQSVLETVTMPGNDRNELLDVVYNYHSNIAKKKVRDQ